MTLHEVLTLSNAGFSAQQIAQLAATQTPPPPQTADSTLDPMTILALGETLQGKKQNPLETEITQLKTQMEELKAAAPAKDPLADLVAKLDALEAKVDKLPLMTTSAPEPEPEPDPFASLVTAAGGNNV